MSRLVLKMPENYAFTTEYTIRISDLNYGNHLSNDAFLSFAQDARMRYLSSMGLAELSFAGVGLIMTDTQIVYKWQGYFGEKIRIDIAAEQTGRASFDIYYRFYNIDKDKEMAHIKTGMLCYSYPEQKVVSIPSEAISKLFIV